MKRTQTVALAIAGLLVASFTLAGAAHAEFKGGTVDLSYSQFTDDGDLSKYGASGQFDFQINPMFGLQGDLAGHGLDLFDADGTAAGIHAYMTPDSYTAFGAFYQAENADDFDAEHLGLEAARDFGGVQVQGYASRAFDGDIRGNLFGLQADVPLNQAFAVGGTLDHANLTGDVKATRMAVNASYSLPGISFYGEVGKVNGDFGVKDEGEAFVGVGAKFRFGQQQKTTFGERGLLPLVPGL